MISALLVLAALTQQQVPDGPYVLVNGLLGADEWRFSLTVPLDENTFLRAHKDSRSLFLAVAFRESRHTGLDLHVKCGDDVRILHVSSALGERVLRGGKWSEAVWGRNAWWSSSPVSVHGDETKQSIVTPEAFEFQLERSRLGPDVSLCLHLKRPEKWLPVNASANDAEHWIRLVLR